MPFALTLLAMEIVKVHFSMGTIEEKLKIYELS